VAAQGDLFRSIALDGTLGKSRNLDIKTECSHTEFLLSAWFCVLAETWPYMARCVKNCSASAAPISRGCRLA